MEKDVNGGDYEALLENGMPRSRDPMAEIEVLEVKSGDEPSDNKAQYCLYGSQTLAAWGARMWEFSIGLSMLELGSKSLLLVSVFGLVKGAAVVLAGSLVGNYIDRTDRLKAASVMYALDNRASCLSAAAVLLALSQSGNPVILWSCIGLAVALGALGNVGALGASLAVEREWTKTLCGDDSSHLAKLNAGMRRIDLICIILPPIMVGFLMTSTGTRPAVVLVMLWNLVSWAPQIFLLRVAHAASPALWVAKQPQEDAASRTSYWAAWAVYFRQSVMPAALSLALLHLTVLSFGLITTAYLKWRGLSEVELAGYRGLGAVLGVSATYLFPAMHAKLGLARTGGIAIWMQLTCLTVGVVPTLLIATSRHTGTLLLTWALVCSRLGLWLFELCVSQMLQEWVPQDQLGAVNGVQGSLASFLGSASYLAGVISPEPQKFGRLTAASWIVVFVSAILYSLWNMLSHTHETKHVELDAEVKFP